MYAFYTARRSLVVSLTLAFLGLGFVAWCPDAAGMKNQRPFSTFYDTDSSEASTSDDLTGDREGSPPKRHHSSPTTSLNNPSSSSAPSTSHIKDSPNGDTLERTWTLPHDLQSRFMFDKPLERSPLGTDDRYDARDVASFFIAYYMAWRERNLPRKIPFNKTKLIKLLYFAHGTLLAWKGEPVRGRFQAWKYGPVEVGSYQEWDGLRKRLLTPGRDSAALARREAIATIEPADRLCLEAVFHQYLRHTAEGLVELVHHERPWFEKKAQVDEGRLFISLEDEVIRDFFLGPKGLETLFESTLQLSGIPADYICDILLRYRSQLLTSSLDRVREYHDGLGRLVKQLNDNEGLKKLVRDHGAQLRDRLGWCQFHGQTLGESIMGWLLLPAEFIDGPEFDFIYYQHKTLPHYLAMSAGLNNPMARYHLAMLFKEFDTGVTFADPASPDADTSSFSSSEGSLSLEDAPGDDEDRPQSDADPFYDISRQNLPTVARKLIQEAQHQFENSSSSDDTTTVVLSNLYLAKIAEASKRYSRAVEYARTAQNLFEDIKNPDLLLLVLKTAESEAFSSMIELIQQQNQCHAPTQRYLARVLEKRNEGKKELMWTAMRYNYPPSLFAYGALMCEEAPDDPTGLNLLKRAAELGSYGAALHIAHIRPDLAEWACQQASANGFQSANFHLGEYYEKAGKKIEALGAYRRSGLSMMDAALLKKFGDEEQREFLSDLDFFWDFLKRHAGLDADNGDACEWDTDDTESYEDAGNSILNTQEAQELNIISEEENDDEQRT